MKFTKKALKELKTIDKMTYYSESQIEKIYNRDY